MSVRNRTITHSLPARVHVIVVVALVRFLGWLERERDARDGRFAMISRFYAWLLPLSPPLRLDSGMDAPPSAERRALWEIADLANGYRQPRPGCDLLETIHDVAIEALGDNRG